VTTSAWAKATFGSRSIYTGLPYSMGVCLLTLVVGGSLIKETHKNKINA
jgi:hypothetical protein